MGGWVGEEMHEWWEAVAAVKRVNPATKHRVAATGVYDTRSPPRSMSLEEEAALAGIIDVVAKWNGHDSSFLLATGGNGVNEFTFKQLGHQLWLCGSEVDGKRRPPHGPGDAAQRIASLPFAVCPLSLRDLTCRRGWSLHPTPSAACSQAAVAADSPTLYSPACGVFALLSGI